MRPLAALLAGFLSLQTASCFTITGTIIGASTDRFDSGTSQPADAMILDRGTPVELRLRNSSGEPVRGEFLRRTKDSIVVGDAETHVEREVLLADVTMLRARVGSYWVHGLVVGLLLDVVTTVLVVSVYCGGPKKNGYGPCDDS